MRRVLEFRKFPESGTSYPAVDEVLDIVVYRVIRHWAFDYIMGMRLAMPTRHYKIKPFLRHTGKSQDIQMRIGTIPEMRQPSPAGKPYRPPNSLLPQHGTVEAISKVLGVLCLDYARDFDNYTTAMTNQHWCFRRLALLWSVALHAQYYSINQSRDVAASAFTSRN